VYDKVEKKEKKASFVATKLVFLPPPLWGPAALLQAGARAKQVLRKEKLKSILISIFFFSFFFTPFAHIVRHD